MSNKKNRLNQYAILFLGIIGLMFAWFPFLKYVIYGSLETKILLVMCNMAITLLFCRLLDKYLNWAENE